MIYCQVTLFIDEFSIVIKINNKNISTKIGYDRATLLTDELSIATKIKNKNISTKLTYSSIRFNEFSIINYKYSTLLELITKRKSSSCTTYRASKDYLTRTERSSILFINYNNYYKLC